MGEAVCCCCFGVRTGARALLHVAVEANRAAWAEVHVGVPELQGAGVPMAAMSNYPAPWAPLIEDAVNLSQLVPWAFVSGEVGLRKPSPEDKAAMLDAVDRALGQIDSLIKGELEPVMKTLHTQQKGQP